MPSIGDKATAIAEKRVRDRLVKIYSKARKDMMEQMKEFNARFARKDQEKRAKVKAGQMTQEDYDKWKRMQVLQSDIWRQKVEQATKTLEDANRQALRVINGEKMDVFAENANYEAYRLCKDTGIGYGFSVYDKDTVGKLIREQPELMPRKVVKGKKDRAWNRTKISNAVTQSIIEGESLQEMTERIARETAHDNDAAMARYAATAMTSAQNAGRLETMKRANGMGIKVRKKWIATLDARTRDSHQALDGQVKPVDEPFMSPLGKIMYPGDPNADSQADVWNCRCTLGYVYDEFPDAEDVERIAAEYYRDEDGNLRSRPAYVKNMSYADWKKTMKANQPIKQETESELESKIQKAVQAVRPQKAQFTPAASREEAEAYAGRFLGYNGKVSYKGVDLEYANKCNQVLADIHETFDVGGLHEIQAMNTREKLWKTSTAEAAYRWGSGDLFINPRYYKSPAAFLEHKKEIDTLMETVMKGGQALIDSGKATGRKKDYIETLLRTKRQCVSQSYDFVEGTFVHECGHMMDDKIVRRELIQAFGGSNVRYGELLAESRAKYGGQISGYAISDNQEYIAESFTAWWFGEGEKCDPVVVGVFERLVKK